MRLASALVESGSTSTMVTHAIMIRHIVEAKAYFVKIVLVTQNTDGFVFHATNGDEHAS